MKAYVIEQAGGPEVLSLQDILSVEPGPEEVHMRRAHGLIESDRAIGKLVVTV